MDPEIVWEPWVEADTRHASLYAAFQARATAGEISSAKLCGVLRDLGFMHELVAEETEAFVHAELLRNQLSSEGAHSAAEPIATFAEVEHLFNAVVSFQSCTDEDGRPLDSAARSMRFPRVNFVNAETGTTALLEAVDAGDAGVVETLLKFGADPDLPREDGTTALYVACQRGQTEMVYMLLMANADPHMAVNRMGASPFYIACHKGHVGVLDEICQSDVPLDRQQRDGSTGLYVAAKAGHVEVVRRLLEAGANPNTPTHKGYTPLHRACILGHVEIVQALLQVDLDLDSRDQDGASALHLACIHCRPAIVEMLLEAKADPESVDYFGNTPLLRAVHAGFLGVAEALLEFGASANTPSTSGLTPLWLARQLALQHRPPPNRGDCARGDDDAIPRDMSPVRDECPLAKSPGSTAQNEVPRESNDTCACRQRSAANGTGSNPGSLREAPETDDACGAHHGAATETGQSGREARGRMDLDCDLSDNSAQVTHESQAPSDVNGDQAYLDTPGSDSDSPKDAHRALPQEIGQLSTASVRMSEETTMSTCDSFPAGHGAGSSSSASATESPVGPTFPPGPAEAEASSASSKDSRDWEAQPDELKVMSEEYEPGPYDRLSEVLVDFGAELDAQLVGGGTLLYLAAQEGDILQVEWLLHEKARPNAPSQDGATPLQAACYHGHPDVAQLLLQHGAEANSSGHGYCCGFPPLHLAAAAAPHPASIGLELFYSLLQERADPNLLDALGNSALRLLCQPVSTSPEEGDLKLPPAREQWPPQLDDNDSLPVHARTTELLRARAEMAHFLIECGAHVDARDGAGRTAVWLAAHAKQPLLLQCLLGLGASPSIADAMGVPPLWVACAQSDIGCARLLIEASAAVDEGCNNFPPLCLACQKGDEALVDCLLHFKAEVAATDDCENTPLHYAAEKGHTAVVRMLLEAGAPLDTPNEAGFTPSQVAYDGGFMHVVELLQAHGANPERIATRSVKEMMKRKDRSYTALPDFIPFEVGSVPILAAPTTNLLTTTPPQAPPHEAEADSARVRSFQRRVRSSRIAVVQHPDKEQEVTGMTAAEEYKSLAADADNTARADGSAEHIPDSESTVGKASEDLFEVAQAKTWQSSKVEENEDDPSSYAYKRKMLAARREKLNQEKEALQAEILFKHGMMVARVQKFFRRRRAQRKEHESSRSRGELAAQIECPTKADPAAVPHTTTNGAGGIRTPLAADKAAAATKLQAVHRGIAARSARAGAESPEITRCSK